MVKRVHRIAGAETLRQWCVVLACLLSAACAENAPRDARLARAAAPIVIAPTSLAFPGQAIPANGGVLLRAYWGVPEVTVTAIESGTEHAGSVVEREGHHVWIPNSALPVGRYQMSIVQAVGARVFVEEFEVVDARAPGPPTVSSRPVATVDSRASAWACCWTLYEGHVYGMQCFATHAVDIVWLEANLRIDASAVELTQLLFRIRASGDTDLPWSELDIPVGGRMLFRQQQNDYCFDIEAVEITTGAIYSLPEVERCAPHGDQGELLARDLTPSSSDLQHSICHAPPHGFEPAWCALNESACSQSLRPLSCTLAGHVCRGEALPESGSLAPGPSTEAGSQALAGVGALEDEPQAGEGAAGSSGLEPSPQRSSASCGVVAGERSAGIVWALGLIALARLRSRA